MGTDLDNYYKLSNSNEAWAFIKETVTQVLNKMCPLKLFHIKNYRPDWMTNELIEQIKDRDYFYRKAKSTRDVDDWRIARFLRNRTNSNIRQAKRDFVLDELKQNQNNPKKFWKVIREIIPSDKSDRQSDILLKDAGIKLDREEVAHYINNYFVNVGKVSLSNNVSDDFNSPNSQSLQDATPESTLSSDLALKQFEELNKIEVLKVIKEINISKSSGLDNISSFIIKELFEILLPKVTYLFNLSIRTETFPREWKSALVIPIPKTGDLTSVKNYRPISLLPLPGKILEKLVHRQLSGHLEGESLLINEQHGFRKDHSTIHSVAQVVNYVNTKMDSKLCTLATYIDFRKAFDCVQHPVLVDKLSKLNFDKTVINWVSSYLSGREQRVFANGTYSSTLPISQGVPQGSVLGPLFYIIYANDLPEIVQHCKLALYADDTVFFTANRLFETSVRKMQTDLNALSQWCKNNGIMANTEKSKVMVFGSPTNLKKLPSFEVKLDGAPLQIVSSYKYLGITLDQGLNYNLHSNRIVSSVSGKLKQFQRMRSFLSVKAALLVYKGTILPLLEYGDLFLNATSVENRKKLQVLQNKCLRCALNKGIETSSDDLHNEASLLKLKYRREQHLLSYMYDWASDPSALSKRSGLGVATRSTKKKLIKLRKPSTEKFKKSLAYYGPKRWNNLNVDLQLASSKYSYKEMVRKMVQSKAYRINGANIVSSAVN